MNEISTSITVSNLTKKFSFPVKDAKAGWVKNLVKPEMKEVIAVNDISFSVAKGECVAFIGPNGAGKSTTIKMLAGILTPTAGDLSVLGLDPVKQRKELAHRIGTVFGQRSQLLPNLPLTDSLEFFGVMYDMKDDHIKKRSAELSKLFELGSFASQPVRKLSLGQRMRAEVAAALIHQPDLIFLDEPTIGLDVVAKKSLRDLLRRINEKEKTTVFLTSHDVGDIESVCERTIIINQGVIVRDLPTKELAKSFAYEKFIDLIAEKSFMEFPDLPFGMRYTLKSDEKVTLAVDINALSVKEALRKLLDLFAIEDIDVYSADLESIIRHVYERDSARN